MWWSKGNFNVCRPPSAVHGTSHLHLANVLARTMGKGTNGEEDTVVCLGLPRTRLECAEADFQVRTCRLVENQILTGAPKITWTTLIWSSSKRYGVDSKCSASLERSSCGRSARSMAWLSRQFALKYAVSMASKLYSMGFVESSLVSLVSWNNGLTCAVAPVSSDGLEPVRAFLARLKQQDPALNDASAWRRISLYPTLMWLAEPLGWSPSLVMELLALVGVTCALMGVVHASWRTTPAMAILWICYLSIVQCGQTFMRFQWDSLLLEVGFLAIWIAPWWLWHQQLGSPRASSSAEIFETTSSAIWTLRFLFFKFMYMSGCVKIQSRCPTWLGLSALDYHYATQPLPLPLAWYTHQAPPSLNALAVAATLLIEGPWTFFLLAPHGALRTFGAITQILLQIPILLTGNYNFFNLLTIILALACLDFNSANAMDADTSKAELDRSWVNYIDGLWQRLQENAALHCLLWALSVVYCVYSSAEVFELRWSYEDQSHSTSFEHIFSAMSVIFRPSVDEVQAWIARTLPQSVNLAASVMLSATLWQIVRYCCQMHSMPKSRALIGLLYLLITAIVSMWVFCSSVLTVSILDRPYQSSLPAVIDSAYSSTAKYRVTGAYGLFRTMTGVGTMHYNGMHYNGLEVPVVARPEIIIEGTNDGGETWKPYEFRYKPGNVSVRPQWVSPFQPRLDWQMWFAALGNYQGDPWIVHLVYKLLRGSSDVKLLLDVGHDPFPEAPPQSIRASLYFYDFTRLNSTWAQRLPNAVVVNASSSQWWTRIFAREYLPALDLSNPSLQAFVRQQWGHNEVTNVESSTLWSQEMRSWMEMLCAWEMAPIGLVLVHFMAKAASQMVISALSVRSKLKSS